MRYQYRRIIDSITSTINDLSLTRFVALIVLFTGCATGTALAIEPTESLHSGRWAQHPVIRQFDATGEKLPATLYLVRTRGELPEIDGIVVYGERSGCFLVSGDPKVVNELTHHGCAVIPLRAGDAVRTPATRSWAWIDTPDPAIEGMIAKAEWKDVENQIQWLVDYESRFSLGQNQYDIASAIRDTLASYGLESTLLPFDYQGWKTLWNVQAIQPGTVTPDSFVVICGHFDSITSRGNPAIAAPGADDNATGTVAVLTAARILSRYRFERSIIYVCFTAEEIGLLGSSHFAGWAYANDIGIIAALNFDMLGFWKYGVRRDLEIEVNHASEWLGNAIINAVDLYTGAPYRLHVFDGAWWGDHASFWGRGFAAANHEEAWDWGDRDFNPHYHSRQDLPEYLSPDFTMDNIRSGIAALATLARPVPIEVAFDVRPGSCRNPFNPKSRGVSTAILLGSADIDVRNIDIDMLRLEGSAAPIETRFIDMETPGGGHGRPCADMSPDGYDDLILTFSTRDIASATGPAAKGDTIRLHLTGRLTDGTGIRGDDTVVIAGEQTMERMTGEVQLPATFALYQNTPNPFNPSTSISFDVPFASAGVKLRIYDVSGRLIRTLADGEQAAGRQTVEWNGLNDEGDPVATGMYFCRLTGPGFEQIRKMVMLK